MSGSRTDRRVRRHRHVRKKVRGTSDRARLLVYRSNAHIYAQLIDDTLGQTLGHASSLKLKVDPADKETKRIAEAKAVGRQVAEVAKAKGILKVCFDRGGHRYHGRVAALADAAREAGLKF